MEAIPLSLAIVVIQLLGMPGLIFLIWHFDNKKLARDREERRREQEIEREERRKKQAAEREDRRREQAAEREERRLESRAYEAMINAILVQYKEDMARYQRMYDNNIELVKNYDKHCDRLEKLTSDLMGVISLSTQVQTALAKEIRTNTFCPQVRKANGE